MVKINGSHNRLIVFIGLVWLLPLACSTETSEPKSGNTVLRRGIDAFPETLNPHTYTSNQALQVLRDIGEGLVTYAPDGTVVPGAAEEWTISEDGRTYTFKLRPNLVYSDGTAISASHFRNSFLRLFSSDSIAPTQSYFFVIDGSRDLVEGVDNADLSAVRVVNDTTIEFQLSGITPYFLDLLTLPVAYPTHPDPSFKRPTSGPYSVKRVSEPFSIELIRNKEYWNDKETYFDEVLYTEMDPATETRAFLAGELDVTHTIAGGEHRRLLEAEPETVKTSAGLGVLYLGISSSSEPLGSNRALRQALNKSIDRESLTTSVTGRGEIPAYSFVPPSISFLGTNAVEYDVPIATRLEEAKRVIENAGFTEDDPLSITIDYFEGDTTTKIVLAVQRYWEDELPVKVTLNSQEPRVFMSRLQTPGEIEIFLGLWTGDYPDPSAFLSLFQSGHPNNFSYFSDLEVAKQLQIAADAPNKEVRDLAYAEIESIVAIEVPVIPLYFYVHKHLVARNLVGFDGNPLNVTMSSYFVHKDGPSVD